MEIHDNESDDVPELALISEARRLANLVVMLLEHPKMRAYEDKSGLYATAFRQAVLLLYFVQESEVCSNAEEFDVLLYLICCYADGLALTLSLLRIP
ncbi:MAG: hypothetical protein JWP03_2469 [Phycisphaerales bacterium]|nr:hypothetical protein [Phycisphaerales bacterium]